MDVSTLSTALLQDDSSLWSDGCDGSSVNSLNSVGTRPDSFKTLTVTTNQASTGVCNDVDASAMHVPLPMPLAQGQGNNQGTSTATLRHTPSVSGTSNGAQHLTMPFSPVHTDSPSGEGSVPVEQVVPQTAVTVVVVDHRLTPPRHPTATSSSRSSQLSQGMTSQQDVDRSKNEGGAHSTPTRSQMTTASSSPRTVASDTSSQQLQPDSPERVQQQPQLLSPSEAATLATEKLSSVPRHVVQAAFVQLGFEAVVPFNTRFKKYIRNGVESLDFVNDVVVTLMSCVALKPAYPRVLELVAYIVVDGIGKPHVNDAIMIPNAKACYVARMTAMAREGLACRDSADAVLRELAKLHLLCAPALNDSRELVMEYASTVLHHVKRLVPSQPSPSVPLPTSGGVDESKDTDSKEDIATQPVSATVSQSQPQPQSHSGAFRSVRSTKPAPKPQDSQPPSSSESESTSTEKELAKLYRAIATTLAGLLQRSVAYTDVQLTCTVLTAVNVLMVDLKSESGCVGFFSNGGLQHCLTAMHHILQQPSIRAQELSAIELCLASLNTWISLFTANNAAYSDIAGHVLFLMSTTVHPGLQGLSYTVLLKLLEVDTTASVAYLKKHAHKLLGLVLVTLHRCASHHDVITTACQFIARCATLSVFAAQQGLIMSPLITQLMTAYLSSEPTAEMLRLAMLQGFVALIRHVALIEDMFVKAVLGPGPNQMRGFLPTIIHEFTQDTCPTPVRQVVLDALLVLADVRCKLVDIIVLRELDEQLKCVGMILVNAFLAISPDTVSFDASLHLPSIRLLIELYDQGVLDVRVGCQMALPNRLVEFMRLYRDRANVMSACWHLICTMVGHPTLSPDLVASVVYNLLISRFLTQHSDLPAVYRLFAGIVQRHPSIITPELLGVLVDNVIRGVQLINRSKTASPPPDMLRHSLTILNIAVDDDRMDTAQLNTAMDVLLGLVAVVGRERYDDDQRLSDRYNDIRLRLHTRMLGESGSWLWHLVRCLPACVLK